MEDAYWRYGESRQQSNLPPLIGKRPRSDYGLEPNCSREPKMPPLNFPSPKSPKHLEICLSLKIYSVMIKNDVPSGHELPGYFTRDDERAAHRVMRDTDSIGASYDRYLRSAQISSYGGGDSARPLSGGLSGRPADDPRIIGIGGSDPAVIAKNRSLGLGNGRPELPLPPDATNTLFVEGLPANCTRREVSHIFRPFVGYKEVRLVTKESRHPGGDPLVLCFVDFVSPAHAATAMDALQGYKFDEHDRDSVNLRLQFARYPGARSGGGHRGKR